jgi:TolB protein
MPAIASASISASDETIPEDILKIRTLTLPMLLVALPVLSAPQAPPTPVPPQTPGSAPAAPGPVSPQETIISVDITKPSGARTPIAIPAPISPLTPELKTSAVDPFYKALTDDLSSYPAFVVADPALHPAGARPPRSREEGDAWIATGAQFLLDTQLRPSAAGIEVEAQLWDLKTLNNVLGKAYTSEVAGARRIAHTLANDVVRQFTGRPGPFLARIAFVSDRDSPKARKPAERPIATKEIYLMDWDGQNQWRLTANRNLSLAPDWSPDGKRIVFQSYLKGSPALLLVPTSGGVAKDVPVSTELNSSPSFSPDGKWIAYCGSVKGNPEIFVVGADGTGLRRLTDNSAVDSTPRWAPNGRELAFTSNRQGTPQIYLMDTEGANVRRLTLAGTWNDEATFAPDGSRIAFACQNEGELQICVLDLLSGRTFQISSGPGAHESPTWSPDGSKIAWEVTRNGSTQILVANSDGSSPRLVTSTGNNTSPAWSKTLE